jgi:hypothetical protein
MLAANVKIWISSAPWLSGTASEDPPSSSTWPQASAMPLDGVAAWTARSAKCNDKTSKRPSEALLPSFMCLNASLANKSQQTAWIKAELENLWKLGP